MLIESAEDFAKEETACGIYMDTTTLNHVGRSFYEALGYKCGYEMPGYYKDNLDGVTYQKFFYRAVFNKYFIVQDDITKDKKCLQLLQKR